jgi:arginyl-tRNA synthetase
MKPIIDQVSDLIRTAIARAVPEAADADPLVRAAQDEKFGDYQANAAMGLGKRLKKQPRQVAQMIVDNLDAAQVVQPPEIAGPGFINLRLKDEFLATQLESIKTDSRLGISPVADPKKIALDFAGPNLAKEMHAGHMRTTIIGDTIGRFLEFAAHNVLRINHVGDWGTTFGMLIHYLRETQPQALQNPDAVRIADLETFYKQAKQQFDADPAFADAARRAVVDLQSGDPTTRTVWKAFMHASREHADAIFARLGVTATERGESFYNDMLAGIVAELKASGMAVVDQGAVCVFLDGFVGREGQPQPMLIQKTDGGYNYDTTDLAAAKYRLATDKVDWLIYVTDVRQKQHFEMIFAAARKAGWLTDKVRVDWVGYGMMLGPDGKVFKTRSGETVKLKDLLDEAEARAQKVVDENSAEFPDSERQQIARAVGIGAIKYVDLSHNLASDYRFDWDKMLSLEGNTAPYMMYAYARIRSIGRKGGIDYATLPADTKILITNEFERRLAKKILQFAEIFQVLVRDLSPNVLTGYLFETAQTFSSFYRECPVLQADSPGLKLSRLRLCDITARTIKLGLHLLGIETVERM